MELYGIAAAFLHDKHHPNIVHVHCNPISMIDGQREKFTLVKDLAYKESVDLTDIAQTCKAFTRFMTTWEEVIRRQKANLEKDGHEYLPIAMFAGDAAFNQLNFNALCMALTGQRFSSINTPMFEDEIQKKWNNDLIKLLTIIAEKYKGFSDEAFSNVMSDPDIAQCQALMDAVRSNGMSGELVNQVAQSQKEYLKEHNVYPVEFLQAFGKLPHLFEQTFHRKGRFSNSGGVVYDYPPDFTDEVRLLKQPFLEGSPQAYDGLKYIAAALGTYYGKEHTGGSKVFKMVAPKNLNIDPILKEQHPELMFFHWQDDAGNLPFKAAFEAAYKRANLHPDYVHIVLPMEGDHPLYTDPTADMIMAVFQVLNGTRAAFALQPGHDEPSRTDSYHHDVVEAGKLATATYLNGMKAHAKHTHRYRDASELRVAQGNTR